MAKVDLAAAVYLVICTLVSFGFSATSANPDRQCLDCICHASSGCKPNIRCHNTGNGQYYCGPYQISWAYWADAGKPGYNGFSNDFENCLVDKNCAEATVRGYMAKWGSDCNGDGRVDCLDYAAIHKTGPTGCNQQWLIDSKYWNQLNQCYKRSSSSSSSVISSTSTFTASNPAPVNSIIEIPSSNLPPHSSRSSVNRPSGVVSSSTSLSSSPGPIVHASYSSSYSNENYSHTETEVTESDTTNISGSRHSNSNGSPAYTNTVYKAMLVPSGPLTSSGYKPTSSVSRLVVTPSPNSNSYNQNGGSVLFASVATAPAAPAVPSPAPAPAPAPTPSTGNFEPIVSGECLQCLCQASSKCKLDKGCDGAYCGPYLLSWGYWSDGGRPGNGLDYPTCARNSSCAELAVQGYMNKWNRDCNNDGEVDCIDFALIHKLGPHACGRLEALKQTPYWNQFESCYNYNPSSNADIRTPNERSIVLSSNSNSNSLTSDRFIGPARPQNYAISSSGPTINVERTAPAPLPAPVRPTLNQNVPSPNFISSSGSYRPDSASVHISFNNRDVVNTNPRPTQPPLTEIPNNINSNIISNSPFRATFSNSPLATRRPLRSESYTVSSVNYPRLNPAPINNPNPIVPVSSRNFPDNSRTTTGIDRYYTNSRHAENSNRPLPDIYDSSVDNLDDPALYESNSPRESPSSGLTEVIPPSSVEPQRFNPAPAVNVSRSTTPASNHRVPQECLECICHASSRCSSQIGCINDGANKFICGPYQVDWEYWTEAGKPGNRADLSNLENFQMCLNNRECADQTVRGYMDKFYKDCNEDGVIDCNDYAALHVAGPRACNAKWYAESKYFSDFRECFDFRRR